jgi:3-dehydroquinate dehydratase-2
MKNILIINGPNLNLLGKRKTSIYGEIPFDTILKDLIINNPTKIDYLQSNYEGEIIETIHNSTNYTGIVLNAGGYTHTSVAIRDAIEAVKTPVVEVHISNIAGRESFRHESMISPVCVGCIFGFGILGYQLAIDALLKLNK